MDNGSTGMGCGVQKMRKEISGWHTILHKVNMQGRFEFIWGCYKRSARTRAGARAKARTRTEARARAKARTRTGA